MEYYNLLIDLHKSANRQGPGGDAETEKALSLAMIDRATPLKITDIGCGTGNVSYGQHKKYQWRLAPLIDHQHQKHESNAHGLDPGKIIPVFQYDLPTL